MKRIVYVLFFLLSVAQMHSQTLSENVQREFQQDTARIENRVRNGFLESTAGFIDSMSYLETEYDKLLNKYYRLLMANLDEEGKAALKSAQINWIKFQTNDRKLLDHISAQVYRNMGGGTLSSYVSAPLYGYIIKDRAIELYEYYYAVISSKQE